MERHKYIKYISKNQTGGFRRRHGITPPYTTQWQSKDAS